MIVKSDCLDFLKVIDGRVACVIADPPDNLGLAYDGYVDRRSDYYTWLRTVIQASVDKSQHFWLTYYWKHDLEISSIVRDLVEGLQWKKYIWRFNFGQYQEGDCPNGHRTILRISQPSAVLRTTASGFRVPSARAALYRDKRAAGLRVPDDVWEFPRITGNSHERRDWHPTQIPEGVYTRMIRMSTQPGDVVVDLFGGTGTLFRAGQHLPDRRYTICEQSALYCSKIAEEHHCPDFNIFSEIPDSVVKE